MGAFCAGLTGSSPTEPAMMCASRIRIQYQDVIAAARYLQASPEVDGDRIGIWGGSYGGYLTRAGA